MFFKTLKKNVTILEDSSFEANFWRDLWKQTERGVYKPLQAFSYKAPKHSHITLLINYWPCYLYIFKFGKIRKSIIKLLILKKIAHLLTL